MHEKRAKSYEKTDLKNIFNIPQELRDARQWLVWRLTEKSKNKPAKVPYDAKTGAPADPTNPKSWSTLLEAVKAYGANPYYNGVGFVFTEQDPYTGIDIDDCVDKETGEIGAWAKDIIKLLDSYTEVSPSGTGVHIIVKAKPPGERSRTSKIEMYSARRYFTMAGNRLGARTSVEERQAQIEELYQLVFEEVPDDRRAVSTRPRDDKKLEEVRAISDEKLLKRAMRKENFAALWGGSAASYSDDLSRATQALLMMLAYWTRGDSARMDRLFRQSGLMRAKWDSKRAGSTWGAREIEHAVAQQLNFYDPKMDETPQTVRNDTYNADLFVSLADGGFCWVERWKMWLKWNGVYWSRNADGDVREATRVVMNEIWKRAQEIGISEAAKREMAWAIKSGDAWKRSAIERLARDILAQPAEDFDRESSLLACRNGVLDLATGELRTGRREDRLTRGIALDYEPEAKCPRFDAFLREIMREDEEMIRYLWRVIGYTLTGDTSERAFFVFHGRGSNGKSTLIDVLMAMLGEYAQAAKFETFLRKKASSGANEDIAHLAGARMVVAHEADDSQVLDAALVKTLTGQDMVRARFLYANEFQFRPSFKLFFITNQMPRINEAAHALWDRIHYVRFDYDVPEQKIDPRLAAKLKEELSGVLAGAVRGALEWRASSLSAPPSVVARGEELREEMDPVAPFLDARTDFDPESSVRQTELYRAYQAWAKEEGLTYPMSSRRLGEHLKNHRFESFREGANIKMWKGISLKGGLL